MNVNFLYAVVAAGGVFFDDVLDSDTVEVVVNSFVETFPDIERGALCNAGTFIGLEFETGYRCETSFGRSENIADGTFRRAVCEHIAAAVAAVSFEDTASV